MPRARSSTAHQTLTRYGGKAEFTEELPIEIRDLVQQGLAQGRGEGAILGGIAAIVFIHWLIHKSNE